MLRKPPDDLNVSVEQVTPPTPNRCALRTRRKRMSGNDGKDGGKEERRREETRDGGQEKPEVT